MEITTIHLDILFLIPPSWYPPVCLQFQAELIQADCHPSFFCPSLIFPSGSHWYSHKFLSQSRVGLIGLIKQLGRSHFVFITESKLLLHHWFPWTNVALFHKFNGHLIWTKSYGQLYSQVECTFGVVLLGCFSRADSLNIFPKSPSVTANEFDEHANL